MGLLSTTLELSPRQNTWLLLVAWGLISEGAEIGTGCY